VHHPRRAAYRGGLQQLFPDRPVADAVGILQETIHDVRIIPVDGMPHLISKVRQWLGDSRGRWEGDTLVVDKEVYEYACHESNYSLPGILAGARVKEKAAAQKASPSSK
jgi:hypothetical protein